MMAQIGVIKRAYRCVKNFSEGVLEFGVGASSVSVAAFAAQWLELTTRSRVGLHASTASRLLQRYKTAKRW